MWPEEWKTITEHIIQLRVCSIQIWLASKFIPKKSKKLLFGQSVSLFFIDIKNKPYIPNLSAWAFA